MEIRKMKNVCDNCKHEGDNLFILSIADKAIILCDNCLDELKDLTNSPFLTVFINKNK